MCMIFIAFVLVVNSEASNNNDEDIENDRRQLSSCEPCGAFRRPCCFPNLCRHQPPKISKCFKVKG